jgi:hypothetical protein
MVGSHLRAATADGHFNLSFVSVKREAMKCRRRASIRNTSTRAYQMNGGGVVCRRIICQMCHHRRPERRGCPKMEDWTGEGEKSTFEAPAAQPV